MEERERKRERETEREREREKIWLRCPRDVVGWFVIVAIPGHNQLSLFIKFIILS